MGKIIFVAICLCIFVYISIISPCKISYAELLGTLGVFSLGLHFVYGVIFNTEIHMSGYSVPIGKRPMLRFILFILGTGIMFGILFYSLSICEGLKG